MEKKVRPQKKYTCKLCSEGDLIWSWDRKTKRRFLVEAEMLSRHVCPNKPDNSIRQTTCKYCKSADVFWVKRDEEKYELTESYGLPHFCEQFKQAYVDHKEALRLDYAFEKKWTQAQKLDSKCRRCKGTGYKVRTYKSRHGGQSYRIARRCGPCRGIGCFNQWSLKAYLRDLRKKYWPYKPWMKSWAGRSASRHATTL